MSGDRASYTDLFHREHPRITKEIGNSLSLWDLQPLFFGTGSTTDNMRQYFTSVRTINNWQKQTKEIVSALFQLQSISQYWHYLAVVSRRDAYKQAIETF